MKNTKKLLLIVGVLILIVAIFIYCPKKVSFKKSNISEIVYVDWQNEYYGNIDPEYFEELVTSINHAWAFTRIATQKSAIDFRIIISYEDGTEKTMNSVAGISGIPFYVYKNTFDFSVCEGMLIQDSIVHGTYKPNPL